MDSEHEVCCTKRLSMPTCGRGFGSCCRISRVTRWQPLLRKPGLVFSVLLLGFEAFGHRIRMLLHPLHEPVIPEGTRNRARCTVSRLSRKLASFETGCLPWGKVFLSVHSGDYYEIRAVSLSHRIQPR